MIKIENATVYGFSEAIRGMRNSWNSWEKSDSRTVSYIERTKELAPGINQHYFEPCEPFTQIGPDDFKLMMSLVKAGSSHRKFLRMIVAYADITAPLYFWKEFDTYKVGTVSNSCSTMHTITKEPFTIADFSLENLVSDYYTDETPDIAVFDSAGSPNYPLDILCDYVIPALNRCREAYLLSKDTDNRKMLWQQIIQLLPSSYNQRRTIMLNYEVLRSIYGDRKAHKLDEWKEHPEYRSSNYGFCDWLKSLPYSNLITEHD